MAFSLPTREEINAKIDEKGVDKLSKLEEFVYDEEPQVFIERRNWREKIEEAIQEIVEEAKEEGKAKYILEKFQRKY